MASPSKDSEINMQASSIFARSQSRFSLEGEKVAKVVIEGHLYRKGDGVLSAMRINGWKRRYCRVVGGQFPTLTVYAKKESTDSLDVLPLDDVMVTIPNIQTSKVQKRMSSATNDKMHRFELQSTKYGGQQESAVFVARTMKDLRHWVKSILQAKQSTNSNNAEALLRQRCEDLKFTDSEKMVALGEVQKYCVMDQDDLRDMKAQLMEEESAEEAAIREKYRILKEKVVAILHEQWQQEVKKLGKVVPNQSQA